MDDRTKILNRIREQSSTHDCPECGGMAYCAIEAGKSANTCWCMSVEKPINPNVDIGSTCLCRQCLTRTHS